MYPDPKTDKTLRTRSLNAVFQSDMLEWYRQQYNLKTDDPEFLVISPEKASDDFYRRQYYFEIQFGLRKWGDMSPEFLMPPFPTLKQFGGILPTPNGYGFSDSDTVDVKSISYKEVERIESRDTNQSVPAHLRDPLQASSTGIVRSETIEVGDDEDAFWKMIEADEQSETDEWEVIESMSIDDPE